MPQATTDGVTEIKDFDELKKLMESDADFAAQVLKDLDAMESGAVAPPVPEEKTEEVVSAETKNEVVDEPKEPVVVDEVTSDDEVVTVKVKPEWLGTYAKNRTPDEAVLEMHKGVVEKDRTIDFLRKEKIPTLEESVRSFQSENTSLKAELERYKNNVTKQPEQTDEVKTVDIVIPEIPALPDIPSGEDAFDEEKMANYKKLLSDRDAAISSANEARIKLAALENKKEIERVKSELRGEIDSVKRVQQSEITNNSQKTAVKNEYAEIEDFRKRYPDMFSGDRTIQEIEGDFIKYMEDIALISGINGGIYKDDGRSIRDDVRTAVQLHQDASNKDGEDLRVRATERGISVPADMDVLNKVYAVRGIRKQYGARNESGEFIPIDWDAALAIAKTQNNSLLVENDKFQSQVEMQNKREKAIQNRKSFAQETKVGEGQGQLDIANFPMQQFNALMAKDSKSWSETEKDTLRQIAKHFNMRPEELNPVLVEK
jgi:hypothetical protein